MSAIVQPRIVEVISQRQPLRTVADVRKLVEGLTQGELQALLNSWDLWALPHQRMPEGKWRRWVLRGGRGSGKSAAAHNTLHKVARDRKRVGRGVLAIVGRTHTDVRTNNILDPESGVLATAPPDFKPEWSDHKGILRWPNGVICYVLSGDAPGSLRGKNISFLVADELPEWPHSERTWFEELEPAVRKGAAQIMITMTPKPLPWLRKLEAEAGTVVTGASTFANPFLAQSALDSFVSAYAGKEIGRQELGGEYIDRIQGTLLAYARIEANRIFKHPRLRQIIVAVDPATTSTSESDETGIIVYGVDDDDHGYVLEDASGKYEITSGAWAQRVVEVFRKWEARTVVVEANNGGDHLIAGLRAVDRSLPCIKVHASVNKETRADPVATLYETGRIHHVGLPGQFKKLEEEWTTWIPGQGKSPNRIDAVVWAATHSHIVGATPASKKSFLGLAGKSTTTQ